MIKLTKGPKPASLAANATAWTAELLALNAQGAPVPQSVLRRYAQLDVKAAVTAESHGKCIYCESRIHHSSFGDLEHIKPKGRYKELTYEWTNLALVCTRCNNAKGDQYDEDVPPVNPFSDDPRQFLVAHGEWIWPQVGNDRGRETVSLVKLNRAELIQQRRQRAEQIQALAEALTRCHGAAAREALREQLLEQLAAAAEYAFVARATALLLEVIHDGDVPA